MGVTGFHGSVAPCHTFRERKRKGEGTQEGSWAQESLTEGEVNVAEGKFVCGGEVRGNVLSLVLLAGEPRD